MTDDTTKHPAARMPERPIVYVREADPAILPDHLRGAPHKIYALHDAAGKPIAIAPDRAQAFALARDNALTPLSVH